MTAAPAVGVVVPLFKHSVLVGDALASLIAQTGGVPFVAVVVNDGCPFRASHENVQAIRALHPSLIHCIARPNGGLSAARNSGIDYLLRHFPSLQAIYFMDADNRLRPRGIATAFGRLICEPGADWVYPNIDMFGQPRHFDYCGPYSLLQHVFYNICEAGSLVHRRVFEAGIRFDPSMRHGYEDWEFWLSAAARGFRGVHEPHFGFLYRNRAESMLSQSKRDDAAITAYVRAKHPELWRHDHLLALETRECPRHAVIFLDTGEALVGLGKSRPALARDAFETLLWRNIVNPGLQAMPPILVFTTRDAFDRLEHAGLLAWALYDGQVALAGHHLACLQLTGAPGRQFAVRRGHDPRQAHLLAVSRDILAAVLTGDGTAWIEGLPSAGQPPSTPAAAGGATADAAAHDAAAGTNGSGMKVACTMLVMPSPSAPADASGACIYGFLHQVMQWRRHPFREAATTAWTWRERSVPPPHDLFLDIDRRLGGTPIPVRQPGSRSIGFVLPIGGFGGVERVAFNTAAVFAAAGWSAHLVMLGTDSVELPEEFAGVFSTLTFLRDTAFGRWDGERGYLGTALPAAGGDDAAARRIAAALGWLDVVVNHHSGDLNLAAALLRRGGTVTVNHLHLLDASPLGRPMGHAVLALAYEHAYDLVACGASQLLAWMRAAGVPGDKLVLVANAPGHAVAAAVRRDVLARRAAAPPGRLHVLYLGRLDRQKGIGRLAEVIAASRRLGLPVDWRIVGAASIDEPAVPRLVRALAEPPVTDAAALTGLFAWADVMVLLSDFEGVPLVILEAQRLGVCVIATDVGGIGEVIDAGRNGFLVPVRSAVEDTVELLQLLLGAPSYRQAISQEASAAAGDWPQSCQALLQRLTRLTEQGHSAHRQAEAP